MHGAFSLSGVPYGLGVVEGVVVHALVIVKEGRVKVRAVLLQRHAIVHDKRANDAWSRFEHRSGVNQLDLGRMCAGGEAGGHTGQSE